MFPLPTPLHHIMLEPDEHEYFLGCVLCDMIIENSDPVEEISIKNHLRKEHVSAFAMGSFLKELEKTNATEKCLSCSQVMDIVGQLRSDIKEKYPFLRQMKHVIEHNHSSNHANFGEIGIILPQNGCDTRQTSLSTIEEVDENSESADKEESSHSSQGSTENLDEFSDSFLTDELGENWKLEKLDAISQERLSSPPKETTEIETNIEMKRPRKRKYVFEDVYVRDSVAIPQRLEKARPQLSEALETEKTKASVVNESITEEPPVEWRPNREIPLLTRHFASMDIKSENQAVNPQNFDVKLSQHEDFIKMQFAKSQRTTENLQSIVQQIRNMSMSRDNTEEPEMSTDHVNLHRENSGQLEMSTDCDPLLEKQMSIDPGLSLEQLDKEDPNLNIDDNVQSPPSKIRKIE